MPEPIFVLSGGVNNEDPDAAIGGPPSSALIDASVNNLFSDVTGSQVAAGLIDYRCFYSFNDSDDDFADYRVWIDSGLADGSTCRIGISTQNEKQSMTFYNVGGGNFTLSLDGSTTAAIDFSFTPSILAASIQAALSILPYGGGVVVTSVGDGVYQAEWTGINRNRAYPMMAVVANGLIPGDPLLGVGVAFARVQGGSPVNSITVDTDSVTTAPSGIAFGNPHESSPIQIGTFRIGDGIPIWIRRTTEPETESTALDGVTIKCRGDRVPGGGI